MSQRRAGPCGLFSRAEEKKLSDDVIEGGFYFIRDSLSNFISRPPPDSHPLGNGEFGKSCAGQGSQFGARANAHRLQPQVRFRHRVVLGHVLLCVSEVSFFFVSALATVAMFDHWRRSQFVFWKLMLLVSAIFAFFCYKRQLASVGDALLEAQPERAGKATTEG